MPLTYGVAPQQPAPVVVMALAAGEVQLASAPKKMLAPLPKISGGRAICLHCIGPPSGEAGNKSSQRQEFCGFLMERRRSFLVMAKGDFAAEVNQSFQLRVKAGIAGGEAGHGFDCMATAAGRRARCSPEEGSPPLLNPKITGVGKLICLELTRLPGQKITAGFDFPGCQVARFFEGLQLSTCKRCPKQKCDKKPHSTSILAEWVDTWPDSWVHRNTRVPDSVARV